MKRWCEPKWNTFNTFNTSNSLYTGLSLSFHSPVVLIFTPVANVLLYGWIVHVSTACTGQFTRNIKGPSAVTGATGYGPYWQPCVYIQAISNLNPSIYCSSYAPLWWVRNLTSTYKLVVVVSTNCVTKHLPISLFSLCLAIITRKKETYHFFYQV